MVDRPMMVVAQHAIGYPELTWAEVSRQGNRIGVTHHADCVALPLWSMQELHVMDHLHKRYLLELRLGNLSRMTQTWQDNWLEMLLERCCTYRTSLRWYGQEMTRALTYERWLVQNLVALVVVADATSTYHQTLVEAAQASDVPVYRIDPDTHEAFKTRTPTKERPR